MKKTILAISIVSAMISGNVLAISNEDLLDIDNILNIDTKDNKTSTKKEDKPEVKNNTQKKAKAPDNKTKVNNESVEQKLENKTEEPIAEEIVLERKPLIPVPITGENISLKIDVIRDRLIKNKIGSDEVIISKLDKIDPKFENEKEVKEVTDTVESFSAVSVYQEDKDVFIDKNKIVDLEFQSEILGDFKTGYSYFINLIEVDKRLNRVKLKIDINVADVVSYNETRYQLSDGSYQKIKLPSIITTNNSKIFWIDLESGSTLSYKIDDIHLIKIEVQRVIPFINQVFVTDHEKIKQMEELKKQEEIKKVEEAKEEKVEEENELFDSLEESLNEK